MKKALLNKFIVVLAVSALSACAVNETVTVKVEGQTVTQVIESNSGVLSDNLQIIDTHTGYAGDLLKAQVSIKNDSGDGLSFRYKFKWLDSAGFEIGVDGRPWTPISITAFETRSIQAVAPNASATTFNIQVQN